MKGWNNCQRQRGKNSIFLFLKIPDMFTDYIFLDVRVQECKEIMDFRVLLN
jgi:hypothetical protein